MSNLRAGLDALAGPETARWEIDVRLAQKERQFEQAAFLAYGLRIEALANDGMVTPGQPVVVSALVAIRGDADVVIRDVRLDGFEPTTVACGEEVLVAGEVYSCSANLRIPAETGLTGIHWTHIPGSGRYMFDADDIFTGEKRMQVQVVPRFAVELTPEIAITPSAPADAREVRVTVTNTSAEARYAEVALVLPSGWRMEPGPTRLAFTREDESRTVRFRVSPGNAPVGDYDIHAVVTGPDAIFDQGYRLVEYPHTGRRHLVGAATAKLKDSTWRSPRISPLATSLVWVTQYRPLSTSSVPAWSSSRRRPGLGRPLQVRCHRDRRARLRAPCGSTGETTTGCWTTSPTVAPPSCSTTSSSLAPNNTDLARRVSVGVG